MEIGTTIKDIDVNKLYYGSYFHDCHLSFRRCSWWDLYFAYPIKRRRAVYGENSKYSLDRTLWGYETDTNWWRVSGIPTLTLNRKQIFGDKSVIWYDITASITVNIAVGVNWVISIALSGIAFIEVRIDEDKCRWIKRIRWAVADRTC